MPVPVFQNVFDKSVRGVARPKSQWELLDQIDPKILKSAHKSTPVVEVTNKTVQKSTVKASDDICRRHGLVLEVTPAIVAALSGWLVV